MDFIDIHLGDAYYFPFRLTTTIASSSSRRNKLAPEGSGLPCTNSTMVNTHKASTLLSTYKTGTVISMSLLCSLLTPHSPSSGSANHYLLLACEISLHIKRATIARFWLCSHSLSMTHCSLTLQAFSVTLCLIHSSLANCCSSASWQASFLAATSWRCSL